jgi:hypothetical protein
MDEQWRPVLGFEDYYEVSDQGRVRGLARTHEYRGGVRRVRARLLVLTPDADKHHRTHCYVGVMLYDGGKAYRKRVHSLVLEAFVGARPARADVRHLNGVGNDNRLVNLAWGTRAENCADQVLHGTRRRGARVVNAKLNERDIPNIRAELAAGASQSAVGRRYGVSQSAIYCIARKVTWSHVSS